jgi:multiple sugar transport system ATP-binding protein
MSAANEANVTEVTLGLRPESFTAEATGSEAATLTLTVALVEELGADAYVYGTLPGDDPLSDKHLVVRFDGRGTPSIGDNVQMSFRQEEAHVFNKETGLRLG